MEKNYDQVEVPQEEVEGLNSFFDLEKEETTESQNEDAAQTAQEPTETEAPKEEGETEVEVEDSFDGLEIDGEKFDRDAILAWREDAENKANWQKSNTEKAQQLSKWNKLAEKIDGDESFRDHLKDFFFDDPEAVKALGLDGQMTMEEMEQKEEIPQLTPEIENRLKALEEVEAERLQEHRIDQLDKTLTSLEKEHPEILDNPDRVGEFLDFADKNAKRFATNGVPDLNVAFKEWSFSHMQDQLKHYKKLENNGKRNEGKVINTSEVGAREVKGPKKTPSWNDMTMDNPDVAKYFKDN
tara:strand:+ start:4192 stop:5085 length:894 start_codon:yes stop_codon:yes gene_type:complete